MATVYFDSHEPDPVRRERLYRGDLYVYSPTNATREFISLSRELIEQAFAPHSPESAQYEMAVEQYAALLARFKPSFIHHPDAKRCIQKVLTDFGCDPDDIYFEVPKLRTSTSDRYLTAGIAYAWHPHRDTWYSAPQCQLNWWVPIYPIAHDNCMAFHTQYFDRAVDNTSSGYNYHEWNVKHRGEHIAKFLNEDPRPLPAPKAPIQLDPDVRLICPPGGVIIFSGAQLHSSVPNTSGKTRFSVDFRTVSVSDIRRRRGAPNVDSACTGTVIREFRRAHDLAEIPDDVASLLSDGTEANGPTVYSASG
jgi:hypothetical protein